MEQENGTKSKETIDKLQRLVQQHEFIDIKNSKAGEKRPTDNVREVSFKEDEESSENSEKESLKIEDGEKGEPSDKESSEDSEEEETRIKMISKI